LTQLDDETLALLTNRDLIAINQHGHDQKKLADKYNGELVIWTSKGEGDRQYVAVFNLTDEAYRFGAFLTEYGFTAPSYHVREIGFYDDGLDLGRTNRLPGTIGVHGVMLWELRP
jgi:hypothetical protein